MFSDDKNRKLKLALTVTAVLGLTGSLWYYLRSRKAKQQEDGSLLHMTKLN